LIGFVNPKQERRFRDFLDYDEEYVQAMKCIDLKDKKLFRESINLRFKK